MEWQDKYKLISANIRPLGLSEIMLLTSNMKQAMFILKDALEDMEAMSQDNEEYLVESLVMAKPH